MPRRGGDAGLCARLAVAALHGVADALPVSSSGHLAGAEALLGVRADDPVGLHAGSLAATVLAHRGEAYAALHGLTRARVAVHLAAGGIPALAGLLLERRAARLPPVPGLLAGALLLAAADRAPRGLASPPREPALADGAWLGLAQAAALWPGVSRNGATLSVARLRGFPPAAANALSREVGVPVTAGALALRRPPLGAEAAASFTGALAATPLVRAIDRGAPLWPLALERAALAAVLARRRAGGRLRRR